MTEDQAIDIWMNECPDEWRTKEELIGQIEDGRHWDYINEHYPNEGSDQCN